MKKLLTIAFCAAAASVMATDVECGTVGVLTFNCPQGVTQNVMAVAFDDLYSGAASIPVSNIVQTVNLAEGDELYLFNGTQYEGYTLAASGDVKYWTPITENWTLSGGTVQAVAGESASTKTKTAGQGIWLVRKDPTNAVTVACYGKPVSRAVTLAANTRTLCGNPTATPKFPTITDAWEGDIILVPNASGMGYTKGIYKTSKSAWKWAGGGSAPNIQPMAGFWYTTVSGSTPSIQW